MPTPFTILISPTMRCNLTCEGCFAGEYSRDSDMDIDTLQSIVDQANEMGVYLITILGGEPFFREDLLDFYAANPDVYFQVYTNGTLLDEATLDHLAALGNIAPMLSIEGGRELTDARRGPGIFDQIMKTMDGLRERGMVFGYSATVTRSNWQMLVSDEFADLMVDKGAMLAWNFLYMPVGVDPDMSLMLTPSERNQFREGHRAGAQHQGAVPGRLLGRRAVRQGLHRRQALHPHQQRGLGRALHLHALRHRQRARGLARRGVLVAVLPGDPPPAAVQP